MTWSLDSGRACGSFPSSRRARPALPWPCPVHPTRPPIASATAYHADERSPRGRTRQGGSRSFHWPAGSGGCPTRRFGTPVGARCRSRPTTIGDVCRGEAALADDDVAAEHPAQWVRRRGTVTGSAKMAAQPSGSALSSGTAKFVPVGWPRASVRPSSL